jgi:glycosyltransferase involved in cell wall biosynthesis
MSKILYIAPVRDFSGYATASRGYIRALYQAGADLVVRPVRYDKADPGTEYKPTDVERELLRRDLHNIDIVIQHVTPNEMRPIEGKINIAVVAWETTRIPPYWADKLNKFDAVITFCDASVTAFRDSGVTVPIHKVPHTFQMNSYSLDGIKPVSSPSAPDFLKDRYVFYNISQFATKKGLDLLLRAYYGEFHGEGDKVLLMIKTYVNMQAREAEYKKIQGYVEAVKQGMRLPHNGYPPVMLITKTLDEESVKRLHATGDCYVCSSRGEGWCIPAFEALAYGKPLVTTLWGGMGEFAQVDEFARRESESKKAELPNVYPIKYRLEPLIGQSHGDPELYTAADFVAEPSTYSIMRQMRAAMESEVLPGADMNEYDYSVVGPKMLKIIEEVAMIKAGEITNV